MCKKKLFCVLIFATYCFILFLPLLLAEANKGEKTKFPFKIEDDSKPYLETFARNMDLDCSSVFSETQRSRFGNETEIALFHMYHAKICGKKESFKIANYYRGLAFLKLDETGKAFYYFSQAAEDGLDTSALHYYLGKTLLKSGLYSEAVNSLQKTIDYQDKNEEVKTLAKEALLLAKASHEAEESFEKLNKFSKDSHVKRNADEILLKSYDKKAPSEKLSKYNSKILILHFWATWCQPCIKEFPDLLFVYEKYRDKGLKLVFVSQDYKLSSVKSFLKRNSLPEYLPIYYDQGGHLLRDLTYSLGLPATILFNKEGNPMKTIIGTANWKGQELTALVEDALK